ncbi:hypothetical protein ACFOEK_19675 [Litoribrevibacter euphylliae]|uniref:Uncharacterized protein n=1 Tax=Litoribrevibacter euphylliae TaxID=1834034 RepID=A0ABV7HHB7_9GAMM
MYPAAYPHDELKALYPGVYLLHGSIKMGPGMRMNRNMVVLKEGEDLTLINPVRMSEQGLASLDDLGKVRRVIRLGDFHGLDDSFYLDRYQCEFWAQSGQDPIQNSTLHTQFLRTLKALFQTLCSLFLKLLNILRLHCCLMIINF